MKRIYLCICMLIGVLCGCGTIQSNTENSVAFAGHELSLPSDVGIRSEDNVDYSFLIDDEQVGGLNVFPLSENQISKNNTILDSDDIDKYKNMRNMLVEIIGTEEVKNFGIGDSLYADFQSEEALSLSNSADTPVENIHYYYLDDHGNLYDLWFRVPDFSFKSIDEIMRKMD